MKQFLKVKISKTVSPSSKFKALQAPLYYYFFLNRGMEALKMKRDLQSRYARAIDYPHVWEIRQYTISTLSSIWLSWHSQVLWMTGGLEIQRVFTNLHSLKKYRRYTFTFAIVKMQTGLNASTNIKTFYMRKFLPDRRQGGDQNEMLHSIFSR